MRTKKAISPLIASVLLIAFTMAVAAILTSWVTGFTKTQTGFVGEKAEKQVKCTYATFKVQKSDVTYNFSAQTTNINVTVYNDGSEDLYNFTFTMITNANTNPKVYTYTPTNQKTETDPLKSANTIVFIGNTTSGPASSEIFNKLVINAICQKDYKVSSSVTIT